MIDSEILLEYLTHYLTTELSECRLPGCGRRAFDSMKGWHLHVSRTAVHQLSGKCNMLLFGDFFRFFNPLKKPRLIYHSKYKWHVCRLLLPLRPVRQNAAGDDAGTSQVSRRIPQARLVPDGAGGSIEGEKESAA